MGESAVRRTWINQSADTQLLDMPQSLKQRMVNNIPNDFWKLNEAIDWVGHTEKVLTLDDFGVHLHDVCSLPTEKTQSRYYKAVSVSRGDPIGQTKGGGKYDEKPN
mmetsp:Transcript_27024/g.58841  ORF Transcript_27024/g.58841 Transcript_27024/m.58841 type:complete len:106 (-) Transcript_27024:20-337(-)